MKTKTKVKQPAKAEESFLDSIQHQDGANSIVKKFLVIMELITKNQVTFTFHDSLYYAKGFELDTNEVKNLFVKWTDKEVQLGRLQRIEGCYEYPVFKVISTASFIVNTV
jgi:hypothetical protein